MLRDNRFDNFEIVWAFNNPENTMLAFREAVKTLLLQQQSKQLLLQLIWILYVFVPYEKDRNCGTIGVFTRDTVLEDNIERVKTIYYHPRIERVAISTDHVGEFYKFINVLNFSYQFAFLCKIIGVYVIKAKFKFSRKVEEKYDEKKA